MQARICLKVVLKSWGRDILYSFNNQFLKKVISAYINSKMTTKWPILVHFCGMDYQKCKFSLKSAPFLSEVVEVSRYYFFKKLVVETKMSLPQNFRTTFKQILACIFLSVRPKSLVTLHYEIPCKSPFFSLIRQKHFSYWTSQSQDTKS